jgi:predicted transposase YbfD/YdcC
LTKDDCFEHIGKGHWRIEKRRVNISYLNQELSQWLAVKTVIKVESERQLKYHTEFSTRYYISDIQESAFNFYQRIRGYWGVENQVHYVRDVTQGEDKSRIRTAPLPQFLAIARNLAINLYRDAGFNNMAQAYAERYPLGQRKCQFGLEHILSLFRMK